MDLWCFLFFVWVVFVLFVFLFLLLVWLFCVGVWSCTVTAQWIMYRSLSSSAFGAHCHMRLLPLH